MFSTSSNVKKEFKINALGFLACLKKNLHGSVNGLVHSCLQMRVLCAHSCTRVHTSTTTCVQRLNACSCERGVANFV